MMMRFTRKWRVALGVAKFVNLLGERCACGSVAVWLRKDSIFCTDCVEREAVTASTPGPASVTAM